MRGSNQEVEPRPQPTSKSFGDNIVEHIKADKRYEIPIGWASAFRDQDD